MSADLMRSQTHYVRLVASTRQPPVYLYILLTLVCASSRDYQLLWDEPEGSCDLTGAPRS